MYEKLIRDDNLMQELNSIIDFSLPRWSLHYGKARRSMILSKNIAGSSGRLLLLNKDAGYIFLRAGDVSDTIVYEYQLSIYESPHERFRGIQVGYIATREKGLLNTYESIVGSPAAFPPEPAQPCSRTIESEFRCRSTKPSRRSPSVPWCVPYRPLPEADQMSRSSWFASHTLRINSVLTSWYEAHRRTS